MTRGHILSRLHRIHNQLVAASRALCFIYEDLPRANMNQYDYNTQECTDATLAAAELVLKLCVALKNGELPE